MHSKDKHYYEFTKQIVIVITFSLIICVNFVLSDELISEKNSERSEHNKQEETQSYRNNERRNSEILLRKRRYLTFPAGSSFQLVYDLIIGVVDYTNYLILGVTSALAWQLPSDPPSEIVQHLKDKLKEGTLGLSRNDTVENIQYVDTKPKQKYPHQSDYITTYLNPSSLKTQSSSSYFANHQFHPPMHTKYYAPGPLYFDEPAPGSVLSRKHSKSDNYSIRRNPLTEWKYGKIRKVSPPSSSSSSSFYPSKWSQWWKGSGKRTSYKKPEYVRQHRVFNVFGKRSVDKHSRQKRHHIDGPSLTKFDQIHLRYHRSSRHELYQKIEKYLETHNKNGHECVLKTLCETAQKANEVEPGSFIGEIMRAIFTIPESEDPVHIHKHRRYDEAQADAENCVEKYPLCPESLWKAHFML